jgi:hypothetical protein
VNPLLIHGTYTATAPSPDIIAGLFLVVEGLNNAPKSDRSTVTAGDVDTVLVRAVYENTDVLEFIDTHGDGRIQQNLYVRVGFTDPPEIAGQSTWYHVVGVAAAPSPAKYAADSIYIVELEAEIPPSCACECHADPQCNGDTDVLDVVQSVNVAFRNAPDIIDPNPLCPRVTTDVDCDGDTDVIDVVKFVNVAFRNADPVAEFCDPCAP